MLSSDRFNVFTLKSGSGWVLRGEFPRRDQAMELAQKFIKWKKEDAVKIVLHRKTTLGHDVEKTVLHETITGVNESAALIYDPDPLQGIVATFQDFGRSDVRIAIAQTLSYHFVNKFVSPSEILFNPAGSATFFRQNEAMARAAFHKLYKAAGRRETMSPNDGNARIYNAYRELSLKTHELLTSFGAKAPQMKLAAGLANDFNLASQESNVPVATLMTACCMKGHFEERLQNFLDFGKQNGKPEIWRHVDMAIAEHVSIRNFMVSLVRPSDHKLSSTIIEAIKFIRGTTPNSENSHWQPLMIIAKGIRVGRLPLTQKICMREIIRLMTTATPLMPGGKDEEMVEYERIKNLLSDEKNEVLGGPPMSQALERRLQMIKDGF